MKKLLYVLISVMAGNACASELQISANDCAYEMSKVDLKYKTEVFKKFINSKACNKAMVEDLEHMLNRHLDFLVLDHNQKKNLKMIYGTLSIMCLMTALYHEVGCNTNHFKSLGLWGGTGALSYAFYYLHSRDNEIKRELQIFDGMKKELGEWKLKNK